MVSWRPDPQMTVLADSTALTDESISVELHRIENAVSRCRLTANDYQGKNFLGTLDNFETLTIKFRYGSDSWTTVFTGEIEECGPLREATGQTVTALAYGKGRAVRNTHCAVSYGEESQNPLLNTPKEIWDDLVDNRINKNFDGGNTGYAITKTYIANITNPSIKFISGNYVSNMDVLKQVCQIYTAYRAGSASVHWFVDPSSNLFINTMGAHENPTQWPNYWSGSQAASTLEEGKDFLPTNFQKKIRDFSNKIVLCTDLRKPGYDIWNEDNGPTWGTDNITGATYSTAQKVVGSHSLAVESDGAQFGTAYFPSAENAGWNAEAMGSEISVPTLNFYFQKNSNITEASTYVRLFTTDHGTDYFYIVFSTWSDPDNEWIHRSIPFGPYWKTSDESRHFRWGSSGSPDWTIINGIAIGVMGAGVGQNGILYVDDLHFKGKIIREAKNSWSISGNAGPPAVTAKNEHQRIVHLDTAVDDSCKAADDSGTAARLSYAELLTRCRKCLMGTVTVPLIVDVLPGQFIHVHADKQSSGAFRIDGDFRCKEIVHNFQQQGATTTLHLTDDLTNSFAANPADLLSTFAKHMFVDPEAKNLKATGIDNTVARLTKDYQFDDD